MSTQAKLVESQDATEEVRQPDMSKEALKCSNKNSPRGESLVTWI